MKKVLSLCLGLVSLLFITGCNKSIKYDYDGKGVLVSVYDDSLGLRIDTIYDENGKELFSYRYLRGKISVRIENKYDESGNIIEKNFFNGKDVLLEATKYEYKDGLIFKEEYEREGFSRITSYEYDVNNNLILKNADVTYYHSPDDKIKYEPEKDSKTEYEYDANNYRITETYSMLSDDGIWLGMEKYDYTYDEQGRSVDTISYRPSEKYDSFSLSNKITVEYDSYGKVIRRYSYGRANDTWNIFSRSEYEYDENSNNIEIINYMADIFKEHDEPFYVSSKVVFVYDKNNNVIKRINYSLNRKEGTLKIDSIITTEYKYYE